MFRILMFSFLFTTMTQAQTSFKLKVVDQFSMPVAHALTMIGIEKDIPFKDNLVATDAAGELVFPADWKSLEPVTIDAPGYIRQTLLNQNPNANLTVHLSRKALNPQIFVSGIITNLPVVNKDKLIDFSVVLTTFNQDDFVHINQNQFISPYADNLTLLGKTAPVFSNVSLPEQKENYIIPLTISKPTYTKFFAYPGNKKLISMSGQFPFKPVADDLKAGKSFFDVINYFEILGLGNLNLTITQNTPNANFSGMTVKLDDISTIKAPAINSEEQVLMLPMNAVANYFLPSGIKKLNSQESAQFNTIDHLQVSILAMVKKTPEFSSRNGQTRLSALFVKSSDPTAGLYLPLMNDPTMLSLYPVSVSTNTLNSPNGLYPTGTMATLSEINDTIYNQQVVSVIQPQWEIYSMYWEHQISLPKWPLDLTTSPKASVKIFETTYFAQGKAPVTTDVKSMLDQATHLTKSAVHLQY